LREGREMLKREEREIWAGPKRREIERKLMIF